MEIFAVYIQAVQRKIVNVIVVSEEDQKSLKLTRVSTAHANGVSQVPSLLKSTNDATACSNPTSIMMELAKAAYLDEVLFAGHNSKERFEILSFIELAQRLSTEDMIAHLNKHLAMRMFLVGLNITAADIIVHLFIASAFRDMMDFQKFALPNAFRWLDHI